MNCNILKGAIHFHTKYSDGSADIDEISKAAKQDGLDWIIVTDHNTMQIKEGIYNDVVVIVGEEITPETCNHYLALNIKDVILPSDEPLNYINEVRNQCGFGFMAHPDERDNRKNKFRPLKWKDKNILGDGIEIWNWLSDWANNVNDSNIFYLSYAYFFRHKLIKGPEKATLAWWDEINNASDKIFPAIVGIDAHCFIIKKYIIPLKVFSYPVMFNTLCNVLYYNEQTMLSFEDKKQFVLDSLKSGNNLMVNRHVLKTLPEIFVQNDTLSVFSGGCINLDDNTFLRIRISKNALIKVFLNGKKMHELQSDYADFKIIEKGKYRVEIFYKNQPWAYSNPIIVY